jgi:hypothetical protein
MPSQKFHLPTDCYLSALVICTSFIESMSRDGTSTAFQFSLEAQRNAKYWQPGCRSATWVTFFATFLMQSSGCVHPEHKPYYAKPCLLVPVADSGNGFGAVYAAYEF